MHRPKTSNINPRDALMITMEVVLNYCKFKCVTKSIATLNASRPE